jgi:hypothetical protein
MVASKRVRERKRDIDGQACGCEEARENADQLGQ